jgi:hypothetical protein
MRLEDGSHVLGTNAADTGPDGTVYLVGAVEIKQKAGEPVAAGGRIAGIPYRLALLIYRPH